MGVSMRVFVLAATLALLAAPGARAADTRVRFAYVPVVGAAPLFVFTGAGWAKDAGLDIAPTRFDSGPPAISALASGTIDALAIGIAPIAVARAKGLDVRIVSAVSTGGSGFVASPALAAALGSGVDVAGAFAAFHKTHGQAAKLATLPPGGVPTITLSHWLFKQNNTARDDVRVSAMGIDAVQQAVLSGAVDGGTVLEPALTIVLARDPKLKMTATSNDMFPGIPGVVIAISGAFAKAHPDAVDAIVALTRRASDFIVANPAEAARYVQPVFGGGLVDQATLAKALSSNALSFVADPHSIEQPTKTMLDYQVELGDFDKAPSTEGLFDFGPWSRLKP